MFRKSSIWVEWQTNHLQENNHGQVFHSVFCVDGSLGFYNQASKVKPEATNVSGEGP